MHPAGGDGFDFPHHIREAVHRPESNEQMDMVSDAADGFRDPVELFYDAAEESMETIPPRGGNHADAFLRAEDEMVVERKVSGCHGAHKVRRPCRRTFFAAFRWLAPPAGMESARDHFQRESGLKHPDTLNAMHQLADSYRGIGRLEEAAELWEQALAGRRKVLGPEHPDTLRTLALLSAASFNLGRQSEAIELSEEGLGLHNKAHGREHLATLSAMHGLAFLYAKTGRPVEAAKLAEEVLAGRREQLGARHADTLLAMVRLAEVYGYADRRDKAYPLFKEVLPLLSSKFGPDHPETVNAATHLGRWCSNWAWDERVTNPERARELASEGERLVREALPVFETGVSTPPYHLACIRSRLGAAVSVAAFTDPALTPAEREQKMIESEALMQRAQTAIGGDNLGCQRDAIIRFIRHYEAWPKAEKLAEWRRRLEAFDLGLAAGK